MHEYDLIADWYARDQTHLTGLPEVQALADSLPPGASVLDVGCGNGIPLTRFLVEAGFDVLGVGRRWLYRRHDGRRGVPLLRLWRWELSLPGETHVLIGVAREKRPSFVNN